MSIDENEARLMARAESVRQLIVKLGKNSPYPAAHYGGALSAVEASVYIFSLFLRLNKDMSRSLSRDRFVLSKGHACLVLYACLVEFGLIDYADIQFEENGSSFAGHPVIDRERFLDFSTGSLGNGLGYAVGAAIGNPARRVACMVGDGEMAEGAVWEALRVASRHKLNNLLLVVDQNELQQTGKTSEINGHIDTRSAIEAFGWKVYVLDGHNFGSFLSIHSELLSAGGPVAILAETVKGKGVPEFEGSLQSHHTVLPRGY